MKNTRKKIIADILSKYRGGLHVNNIADEIIKIGLGGIVSRRISTESLFGFV